VRGAEQALATLRDYVERSTHWQEGGADRHAAKQALKVLDDWMRDEDDGRCPTCGEDGGTSCGNPNCGLLA
jgi:hypothetical protein